MKKSEMLLWSAINKQLKKNLRVYRLDKSKELVHMMVQFEKKSLLSVPDHLIDADALFLSVAVLLADANGEIFRIATNLLYEVILGQVQLGFCHHLIKALARCLAVVEVSEDLSQGQLDLLLYLFFLYLFEKT